MSIWVILTMILRVSFGVVDSVGMCLGLGAVSRVTSATMSVSMILTVSFGVVEWSRRFHWSPHNPPMVSVKVNCFAAYVSPPTAGFPWNEIGGCLLIHGLPVLFFLHAMRRHGYESEPA